MDNVRTFILQGSFPQLTRPGNTFQIKSVLRSWGNIQTNTGPLTLRHGWKKSFSDFGEGCWGDGDCDPHRCHAQSWGLYYTSHTKTLRRCCIQLTTEVHARLLLTKCVRQVHAHACMVFVLGCGLLLCMVNAQMHFIALLLNGDYV